MYYDICTGFVKKMMPETRNIYRFLLQPFAL